MKISIRLEMYEPATSDGYPLTLFVSHRGKRRQEMIARSFPEHWIAEEEVLSRRHPDHDVLAVLLADIKLRARALVIRRVDDVDVAMAELFRKKPGGMTFEDFGRQLISEMQSLARIHDARTDHRAANRISGNVAVYENVLRQFYVFAGKVTLGEINYSLLLRFRNYQIGLGNSKSTIHLYLRTLRAIYNQAVKLKKIHDDKPFAGIFKGLTQKSYSSRKKSIDRAALNALEAADFSNGKQKYIDLFLLQFYFGGCDLVDLYYLKKSQVRRGRVFFERGKVDGPPIDLKIHPKAARLMEKYPSDDDWLFPWNKEKKSYMSFRRLAQRALQWAQAKLEIEVLPAGGNLSIKVARHTFGNLGKQLMLHEDLLRELMGHERDDVDNFYKDAFPQAVRDEALFRVIDGLLPVG